MLIGEVAEQTGTSRKAIRFYEQSGLIPPPKRSDGHYRLYSQHDVFLVVVIKFAQSLGFNLSDLKELLARIAENKCIPVDYCEKLVNEKRQSIKMEMESLMDIDHRLEKFLIELTQHQASKPAQA